MLPLGLAMLMGWGVGLLLMTAAEMEQKWAVLPLSAMAVVSGGIMVGAAGGPNLLTVDKHVKPESLETLGGVMMRSRVGEIGSPRRQLVEDDVVLS
jgi:hypothetical protein